MRKNEVGEIIKFYYRGKYEAFEEDYARFLGLERGQPKREGNGSVGNRPIMAAVCV